MCFIEFSAVITCDTFPIRLPAWLRLLCERLDTESMGAHRSKVGLRKSFARSPVVSVEVGAVVWKPYYTSFFANG